MDNGRTRIAAVEVTNQENVLVVLKTHLPDDTDLDTVVENMFRRRSGNISFKAVILSQIVSGSKGAGSASMIGAIIKRNIAK